MNTIKEESLRKALLSVGLRSLPRQYTVNSQGFWLKAIVLVCKRNMEECYCLYDRKPSGLMTLVKDFGSASVIFSIKSIHPYLYFDERRFIPSDMGLRDKRMYLLHELDKDDANWYHVPTMDEGQIDRVIFEHGISRQLENLDEDIRLNDINEISEAEQKAITEEDEKKYRSDLFAMIREGRSQEDISAFREAFARRKEAQEARERDPIDTDGDESAIVSEADALRERMEAADEEMLSQSQPERSVVGEFDAPKVDYVKLKAESEEYRQEQIRASKRRWKREHDSLLKGEPMNNEDSFENEFGEVEDIETLQLPEIQPPKVPEPPKAVKKEPMVAPARKRGRPRKVNVPTTRTRKGASKK